MYVYQTEQALTHCKKQLLVGLNQAFCSHSIYGNPNSTPNNAFVFGRNSTA